MRRYEYRDERSAKFWEIRLAGARVDVRYGRIATRGQERSWEFNSVEEAHREWQRRIEEKVNKGYQLVHEDPAEGAANDPAPSAENPELLARVIADPDDDDALLVYGDWLQEVGDPRGELISIQTQMVGETDPARFLEFKKRETAILKEHPGVFYGPLLPQLLGSLRLRWRLGFLDEVTVGQGDPQPILEAVLTSPSGGLVRHLNIDSYSSGAAMAVLSRPESFPALRTLAIPRNSDPLPGIPAMLAKYPHLRSLKLKGSDLDTGPLKLPELKLLSLAVAARVAEYIPDSNLASLKSLAVHFEGDDIDPHAIAALAKVAPKLEELELRNALNNGELLVALSETHLARQLKSVKLEHGTLNDGEARLLLRAFPAVEVVHLAGNEISADMVKKLGKRFITGLMGGQRPPGTPVDYYDEIGE